jgi:dihydrofolate reductase
LSTVFHCHVAVSLDGLIARPDGAVDWLLEEAPPEEFGLDSFYAGVDAILMGRGAYDAVRGMGAWPYADKRVLVVTHRAPEDAPRGVEARGGELGAIVAAIEAEGLGRVWVMGGGDLIRQMMALGRLDVLELGVMPRVLGAGIALFPAGTPDTRFRLVSCAARSGGAVHLVYKRA